MKRFFKMKSRLGIFFLFIIRYPWYHLIASIGVECGYEFQLKVKAAEGRDYIYTLKYLET